MKSGAWLRGIISCSPLRSCRPAAVWTGPKSQLLSGSRGVQTPAASRVVIRPRALAVAEAQQAATDSGFGSLGLTSGLQQALLEAQITQPTEIQVQLACCCRPARLRLAASSIHRRMCMPNSNFLSSLDRGVLRRFRRVAMFCWLRTRARGRRWHTSCPWCASLSALTQPQ